MPTAGPRSSLQRLPGSPRSCACCSLTAQTWTSRTRWNGPRGCTPRRKGRKRSPRCSRPRSCDGRSERDWGLGTGGYGVRSFRAFRAFEQDGRVQGRVVETTLDELSEGDVVIRAAYSSVNYKDALAATGAGKIIRRFPLIPGIDVAGTVVSTADARFHDGDGVLVTGYDFGVAHDG